MNTNPSRRQVMLAAGAGIAAIRPLSAADGALTARQVVDRIQKNVGIPWREQTVDNFKDGSNPDAPLTRVATTMGAAVELLPRAAAPTRNLIVVHQPTYYTHL